MYYWPTYATVKDTMISWRELVDAWMTERSISTLEDMGSNPVIGNF